VAAISAFKRAYEIRPHHAVQCSIARCYQSLSRFVEAAAHYRRCLDEGAARTPLAAKIRTELAAVEGRICWLVVVSPGGGGAVYVDGKPLGSAPLRAPLNPGPHVVEVRRVGAQPARAEVDLVTPGEHRLELVPRAISVARSRAVELERVDRSPAPPPRDAPRRRVRRGWFFASAALTLVAAGGLAACGALTLSRQDDYNSRPTRETYDAFVQARTATNVLVGLTAAAATGTTLLLFYTDFRGGRASPRAAVVGVGGVF
jgi:hypothetical protein